MPQETQGTETGGDQAHLPAGVVLKPPVSVEDLKTDTGIDRRTHYNWLVDPVYQEAFQQAAREAGDALEDKLHDLAHDGNVTAAIFLLKGLRPEKYRDQPLVSIDLGDWNGDFIRLSPRQLDGFIEEMTRRVAANKAREAQGGNADISAANAR